MNLSPPPSVRPITQNLFGITAEASCMPANASASKPWPFETTQGRCVNNTSTCTIVSPTHRGATLQF
jgi:hypothetical protein